MDGRFNDRYWVNFALGWRLHQTIGPRPSPCSLGDWLAIHQTDVDRIPPLPWLPGALGTVTFRKKQPSGADPEIAIAVSGDGNAVAVSSGNVVDMFVKF